jgi:hypothetical protein
VTLFERRVAEVFWLLIALILFAGGCATTPSPDLPTEETVKALCTKDTDISAGKASIELSPYPCVVAKTYAAMEATEGRGFWMGVVPRAFLRTRLVARGIFSTVFGLVGLG